MVRSPLIVTHDFNPYELLEDISQIHSKIGAQSVFIGYMRDFRPIDKAGAAAGEQGNKLVDSMLLQHYSPMTEKQIDKIQQAIIKRFNLLDCFVAHRVGRVTPTQPLVVISTCAAHRRNAIEAMQTLLEELKHNVPFWKKEYQADDAIWVDNNTPNQLS